MQGLIIKKNSIECDETKSITSLDLLAKHNDVEIMLQTIDKDDVVWITPSGEKNTMEFCYIISGDIVLESDECTEHLKKNDSFRFEGLKTPVLLRCLSDLKMLYVTTKPLYDYMGEFDRELVSLINQVDQKDAYTRMHSQHVLDYSIALSRELKCANDMLDRITIAALFHDVGKCNIPDEILKSKQLLTPEQRTHVLKHPLYSKELIEQKFSKEIAYIAMSHHERLDGSGYPQGLSGELIPFEAKIIAVADSFDAMTTKRPYNKPRSFMEAAIELNNCHNHYDKTVLKALLKLVENGELNQNS